MFDFIRSHQLNIMLCLCAACVTMTVMLLITKFLSKRRKRILISMELIATFLLFFDRLAYVYAGVPGPTGYIMVRLSNFIVFFCQIISQFVQKHICIFLSPIGWQFSTTTSNIDAI